MQANLTKSQNEFKIKLKELEDSLLARLSAAGGEFLGDTALVENLETTKRTATEIEEKVSEVPRSWCCGATGSGELSRTTLGPQRSAGALGAASAGARLLDNTHVPVRRGERS